MKIKITFRCVRCKKVLYDNLNYHNVFCWSCLKKISYAHKTEKKVINMNKKVKNLYIKDFDNGDEWLDEDNIDDALDVLMIRK